MNVDIIVLVCKITYFKVTQILLNHIIDINVQIK